MESEREHLIRHDVPQNPGKNGLRTALGKASTWARRHSCTIVVSACLLATLLVVLVEAVGYRRGDASDLDAALRRRTQELALCGSQRQMLNKTLSLRQAALTACEKSRTAADAESRRLHKSLTICDQRSNGLQQSINRLDGQLQDCNRQNDVLKSRLSRTPEGRLLQWLASFQTGGTSWVCSDDHQRDWKYGYDSLPDVDFPATVRTWEGDFSAKPLGWSNSPASFKGGIAGVPLRARVVGYSIQSSAGANGWFRTWGLPTFGGDEIKFEASASLWKSAGYHCKVYYVEL